MMTDKERAYILARIVTRDEDGRHFLEVWPWESLRELEEAGLIEIDRPVHEPTGIRYAQEYWSVRVTREGFGVMESWPECWPE